MAERYSESCCITTDSRTRGVKRVANEVADRYGLSVSIDTETYQSGGIFFKTYSTEYNIRFSGEKENVEKAIEAMRYSAECYNAELASICPPTAASGF